MFEGLGEAVELSCPFFLFKVLGTEVLRLSFLLRRLGAIVEVFPFPFLGRLGAEGDDLTFLLRSLGAYDEVFGDVDVKVVWLSLL